jgi:hypothetical protein
MREIPHTHGAFEGVTLGPGGRELVLDYSDPDQGGTRLCFRYIISLDEHPRIVTGYGPEISYAGKKISFREIPPDVLQDASNWIEDNLEIARANCKDTLSRVLNEYTELLEPGRGDSRLQQKLSRKPSGQTSFGT